jgi:hypothetical protein
MNTEEKKLMAEFDNPANVVESAALFDSIVICPVFYGQEARVPGWFTTFALFAVAREHKFFKSRTSATANDAYTNMESSDSLTYPFVAYSMGLSFHAPASNITAKEHIHGGLPYAPDPVPPHVFQFDLPNHAAVSFKTNQDTRAEVQAYACPPGYGPIGGGAALEQNYIRGINGDGRKPFKARAAIQTIGTQGVPIISNRFPFPEPLPIPKNASIEGQLHISDYARDLLMALAGPYSFVFQTPTEATNPAALFPMRYVITLSLFGKRLVQQRGQYHV